MKINKKGVTTAIAVMLVFGLGGFNTINAATAVNLGTTSNFAVLAGSTITNTGSSVITGDLGLSPGTSVTGFPPGTVSGTSNISNPVAVQAQVDLVTAYNSAGQSTVSTIPAELGGSTLTPGVYDSTSGAFGLTGTLTLNAEGDPNAVFIFKTASTLTTGGASNIVLTNGAQACNVFWQVGSSATLGANSTFNGNILAMTSITLTTGALVDGRVLARNGAVTLDSNTIRIATCAATVPVVTPTPTSTPTSTPILIPVVTSTPTSTPIQTPVVTSTPTSTPVIAPITTPITPPALPDTGFSPSEVGVSWSAILLAGMLISISTVLFAVLRKRTA